MEFQNIPTRFRKATLYLRLEAFSGFDADIADAMVSHASNLKLPVVVMFNGVDMTANPGETASQVLERLEKDKTK